MTGFDPNTRYASRYPRSGGVALLCEGDIVGYEVDLLEKWTAAQDPELLLDVWPCGTKTAIFGMADAIGRAIPMLVLEDRDYRDPVQAQAECAANLDDRRKRAIRIVAWRTWRRHEIENYLLEPEVVVPVLAAAFRVSEDVVRERLTRVVASLGLDQAAQWTLDRLRTLLPDRISSVAGLPRATARPRWDSAAHQFVAPPAETVERALGTVIEGSLTSFKSAANAIVSTQVIEEFKRKRTDWVSVTVNDDAWKTDWAGKDVLMTLARWLAGEFGWAGGNPVDWIGMARPQADTLDREIATALQPTFVAAFLQLLDGGSVPEIREEWNSLVSAIRTASGR